MQCSCTIPYNKTDHTFHILSHYKGKDKKNTPEEFRSYLETFTGQRRDWIEKVGAKIFKGKGITVDDYITALLQDNFVLDQVGIFIFARMYHIHIAVILCDHFLTTNKDNDLNKCDIFLGYFGKMRFCDTRPIKFDDKTLESLSESDNEIKVPSPPQRLRIQPSNPKPKPPRRNFPNFQPKLTQRQLALLAKSAEDPQSSNEQTDPSPTPKPKPGRSTRNSLRAGFVENSENDQTLNNSTDKENNEGGKNFVNKDPAKKYGRSKNRSGSKQISTTLGTITIRTHSVRKSKRKNRKFACLWCKEVFKVLKEFNCHVKDKHPDVKYTCRFCDRPFESYGGKCKHEVSHLPPPALL